MSGKAFRPMTEEELMQRLALPPQHHPLLQEALNTLVHRDTIVLSQGKYAYKKVEEKENVVTGVIHMHHRGFGFVQAEDNIRYPQDIFIPKPFTKNAVDGDTVEVLIDEVVSEKGPEGRVVAILSRARTHMGGIIRDIDRAGTIVAYVPLLGAQQRVVVQPSDEIALKVGDRISMEVVEWGSKETETVCRFSHYLGHISDPSCDIAAAIEEFELRNDFSHATIEEALKIGSRVSVKDIQNREDLRDLVTCTIDPDTAKDFDDALSLTVDKKGHYHLGVHIADVSHYVKVGSALDLEAQQRANSTYFPGTCIPMLPSALSDNLCSLKEGVNRLTVSVLMEFDQEGSLIEYRIARTVIKSAKRFTYREAKAVLDGKKKSPHAALLGLMVDLCQKLKRKRYQRGSLEFALPELVVIVDDKGAPYKTDYVAYDITHQMVEEFMLKANELVAWHLADKGKNLTYRVHDEPAEENLKEFSRIAAAFGFKVPAMPNSQDLQKLFEEAAETPYGGYLATSYIRRMRQAAYSAENIGHYGLSLSHYCHFTSPIRRYVDLIVHRILFGESDDIAYIDQIALHSSEQERISAKAENSVTLLKKLRLLDKIHTEDSGKEYEAIVTKIKPFGLYFEVLELMLEGFVHISELGDDYFVYDEGLMRLRGRSSGQNYTAGDRISVMLQSVNLISLETKWYLAGIEEKNERKVSPIKEKDRPKRGGKRAPGKKGKQRGSRSTKSKKGTRKR